MKRKDRNKYAQIRVLRELHRRIKKEANRRDLRIEDAAAQSFELWLESKK
jgi:hypothetical protein